MPPPVPRRATAFQRLLLVVLSPLVFLVLIEAVVRVSGVSTDLARNKNFGVAVPTWLLADPGWVRAQERRIQSQKAVRAEDVAWFGHFREARFIGIKLKPNLDVKVVNPFNDIEVASKATFRLTSNPDGFRGPAFTTRNRSVLRIAALGDSSTFGWGVDPEYTYEELLARRLSTKGSRAEVYNLGMPGTTSRHGVGVLQHYAAGLRPDVVIVSFGANDARLAPVTADQQLAVDDSWVGAAKWTLLDLRTFQLMRRLVFSWYDPFPRARAAIEQETKPLVKSVSVPDFVANIRKMRGRATVLGAKTVFMAVCSPEDYVAAMRETAKVLDVPFVDAGRIFLDKIEAVKAGHLYPAEAQFYRNLYGPAAMENFWLYWVTTDGCHPNRVGQSVIADALADAVRSTFGQ
jgi:lysophospholipase L1-like esterase